MSKNRIVCLNCKNELPKDSEFCQYCGEKINNNNLRLEKNIEDKEMNNCEEVSDLNGNSIFQSTRFAVIISILLCVVLYLSFLTMAFTNERETYICYTTKTGDCFHTKTCRYASKTAYETTVYEASRRYRPCTSCNPCIDRYKTTVTTRNYFAPILISVPVSLLILFLLTYNKVPRMAIDKYKVSPKINKINSLTNKQLAILIFGTCATILVVLVVVGFVISS